MTEKIGFKPRKTEAQLGSVRQRIDAGSLGTNNDRGARPWH